MTFRSGRSPRPVHIGRGLYVHPLTAKWLGITPKPAFHRKTVRSLFK